MKLAVERSMRLPLCPPSSLIECERVRCALCALCVSPCCAQLNMENDDVIDAMLQQTGGVCGSRW
jgi:hypothetical protein